MKLLRLPESIAIVVFSLATPCLFAQTASTGTVSGQVTDPSATAVKGVVLKLIDASTSVSLTTISNDSGRYDFPNVAPGTYSLTATSPGFALAKVSGQRVEVGNSLTLKCPPAGRNSRNHG